MKDGRKIWNSRVATGRKRTMTLYSVIMSMRKRCSRWHAPRSSLLRKRAPSKRSTLSVHRVIGKPEWKVVSCRKRSSTLRTIFLMGRDIVAVYAYCTRTSGMKGNGRYYSGWREEKLSWYSFSTISVRLEIFASGYCQWQIGLEAKRLAK